VGNLSESDHFEDLGLDSIILKWFFTIPNVRAWARVAVADDGDKW